MAPLARPPSFPPCRTGLRTASSSPASSRRANSFPVFHARPHEILFTIRKFKAVECPSLRGPLADLSAQVTFPSPPSQPRHITSQARPEATHGGSAESTSTHNGSGLFCSTEIHFGMLGISAPKLLKFFCLSGAICWYATGRHRSDRNQFRRRPTVQICLSVHREEDSHSSSFSGKPGIVRPGDSPGPPRAQLAM